MCETIHQFLYFAYGANTNVSGMSQRCPRAQDLGPAQLLDHEFMFATHAHVRPKSGQRVWGVLWLITADCLHSLDMFEACPHYYQRHLALIKRGRFNLCYAWVYAMTHDPRHSPPDSRYLNIVKQGYEDHGLDTKVLFDSYAKSLETRDDNKYLNY